jgi:hypothetical protein
MKNSGSYFFAAIMFCSFSMSVAQSWAPAEAIWRYNFVTLGGRGYIQITVAGDTVVDNINCKALNKRLYQINQFTGTAQNYSIGTEFTYENNGVVFIRYKGVFDTLYNFNALPGESWNVPDSSPVSSVCNTISKIVVADTGHITINGAYLKRLMVDYHYKNSGSFLWRDTLIERIGSLSQYMLPWDLCLSTVDGNEGGELRCYEDNLVGEYKHNFYSNCNVIIGIDENEFSKNIRVFPNPAQYLLNIDISEYLSEILNVIIYNSAGKKVWSSNISENYFAIEINDFAAGLYQINIINEKNEKTVKRFLKL